MARSDSEENRSVALYWDFENLHAGIAEAKFGEGYYNRPDNRFKPQDPLIDIQDRRARLFLRTRGHGVADLRPCRSVKRSVLINI